MRTALRTDESRNCERPIVVEPERPAPPEGPPRSDRDPPRGRAMRESGASSAVRLVTGLVWRARPQPQGPRRRRNKPGPPAPRVPARPTAPAPAARALLSDLDIQLAHGAAGAQAGPPRRDPSPPPPCGRVIGHTVEAWARRSGRAGAAPFRPLVFGGTYPIEVPLGAPRSEEAHRRELRRTIERSLDRFEAIVARRGARSFPLDGPCGPPPPAPRDPDARYYVAGPKTFDIDEPVSFM